MGFSIANYAPPGPVAARFISDPWLVRFLMGPVGGGKTNAAFFAVLRHVALTPPCKDGVIRAKVAVVRSDYRTLYKTTLPSWFGWFPQDYQGSKFIGGADRPATHTLAFTTPRGRRIELIVEFQALGDKRIEDVMRGWEGTAALMEEADLLDESALDFLFQRTSRYPRAADLEPDAMRLDKAVRDLMLARQRAYPPKDAADVGTVYLMPAVFGSLNPPGDPDHWVAKRFKGKPSTTLKLYEQPSGLSSQAENIKNLPIGYYERMLDMHDEWYIRRFVHGKIGYDRSGLPVYPEFDPRFNVAPTPLSPIAGEPIYLGLDCSGLHPAAVIVQRGRNLQLRVLEEFYYGRVGPTRFSEMLAAALQERYRDCPVGMGFYDPSNDYGADKEGGEQSWIDILRRALGVTLVPAPSNEVPLRVEAVRNLIVTPIDAQRRALVVTPDRCPMLIKGFMSHYRYRLNPDGSVQNRANPRPEKNDHANPHDALQYVCLGLSGRAGSIASAAKGMRPGALSAVAGNKVLTSNFQI